MTALYEWGATCESSGFCQTIVNEVFAAADVSEDGLLTWSEINRVLPGLVNAEPIPQA